MVEFGVCLRSATISDTFEQVVAVVSEVVYDVVVVSVVVVVERRIHVVSLGRGRVSRGLPLYENYPREYSPYSDYMNGYRGQYGPSNGTHGDARRFARNSFAFIQDTMDLRPATTVHRTVAAVKRN